MKKIIKIKKPTPAITTVSYLLYNSVMSELHRTAQTVGLGLDPSLGSHLGDEKKRPDKVLEGLCEPLKEWKVLTVLRAESAQQAHQFIFPLCDCLVSQSCPTLLQPHGL